MTVHPVDKGGDIGIAPHPGREALKGRLVAKSGGSMAHVAIDCRRVGPVGFDCNDCKPVCLDQVPGDGGASAIELRCPVTGFS